MGRKRRRIIIISIIFVLFFITIISGILYIKSYMKGNEYSKLAWMALSKEQQKNVIGGGLYSHAEIIKPKQSYIIPDDPVCKMENNMVYDKFLIKFKEGVPYAIARIKIALIDGTIIADKGDLGFYLIEIKGIDEKRLFKLMHKLDNNDFVVESADTSDSNCGSYDLSDVPSEDVKDKETGIVSFYYFKGIKLYKYIVYIVTDTKRAYVTDTQEILVPKKTDLKGY